MGLIEGHAEIEAKLVLPGRDAIREVEAAVRATGMTLGTDETVDIEDSYLDSPDWFFYRAGLACRVRRKGTGARLTFKTLQPIRAGVATRSEWEETVEAPKQVEALPAGELATWMTPALGGRRLKRLVRVRQTRRKMVFTEGKFEVEVSADDVKYDAAGRTRREAMVELELLHGKPAKIGALSRVLQAAHGWTPDDTSKFERALASAKIDPPRLAKLVRPQRGDTVSEGFLRLVTGHFEVLRWNEPGTRVGIDTAFLHDMRVASRRLLAALLVFDDLVKVRARQPLRRSLKRVARALGKVRDLDVYLGNLKAYGRGMPGTSKPVLGPLRKHLAARRVKARTKMLAYLDSDEHATFLEDFGAFAADGAGLLRLAAGREPIVNGAPAMLRARLVDVLSDGRAIRPGSPPDAYHELRKRCKKLRYAAEFFRDLMPTPMTRLRKRQTRLQDLLGAHQDADVSMLSLDAFIARKQGKLGQEQLAGYAALRASQARAAQEKRDTFPEIWAAFDHPEFLSGLDEALDALD